jgi:hypothetical protein
MTTLPLPGAAAGARVTSFFFAAPAEAENPDDWAKVAQAHRTEGSWWPHRPDVLPPRDEPHLGC